MALPRYPLSPEALVALGCALEAGVGALTAALGFERYPAGWADPRSAWDDPGGVTIDGECVEITGLLEAPDGASPAD